MERTMDKDPPVIYFLIPCSQNPESWDAVIVSSEKEERRAVHVVFLKTMTQPEHTQHQIIAKGLNQVRDAVPKTWDCEGRNVHYHYVLVLLTHDNEESDIPQWRHVLISSKEQKKDPSWHRDNLRQYIMFVPMGALREPPKET